MKNDYRWLAPFYYPLSRMFFGRALYHSQIALIPHLPSEGRGLFIGGGNGEMLNELFLRTNLEVTYIEKTAQMIDQCRKLLRPEFRSRITFIQGTEKDIPQKQFDLIFTFYFLDLFPPADCKQLIRQLHAHLKSEGHWYLADFAIPIKLKHRLLVKLMLHFLRITTGLQTTKIYDYRKMISRESYRLAEEQMFFSGLLFSSLFRKAWNNN